MKVIGEIDAQYGLRGVRIREALHPGLRGSRSRSPRAKIFRLDSDEEHLMAATRIDSEDDPLVEGPTREAHTSGPPPPMEGDVQTEEESETESIVHNRLQRRRRLILNFARDREEDSGGEAETEHQECHGTVEEPKDVFFVPNARAIDEVDLVEVFEVRACVMKAIPEVSARCISWGNEVEFARN